MADKARTPAEEEIAKLPRWVQVVFAVRCARRVQPLFKAAWPDAPATHVEAIEEALRLAEKLVSGSLDAVSTTVLPAARAATAAADAAYAATKATAAAVNAGSAAYSAVAAALTAPSDAARHAAQAAYSASLADAAAVVAILRDFKVLAIESQRRPWTDETKVPVLLQELFWRESDRLHLEGLEPELWHEERAASEQEERLVLTAYVNDSVDDDTLVEGITELYRALNKYHILCGGGGLTIDDWRILVRAGAPEGVLA